jgi:hypothetical protein
MVGPTTVPTPGAPADRQQPGEADTPARHQLDAPDVAVDSTRTTEPRAGAPIARDDEHPAAGSAAIPAADFERAVTPGVIAPPLARATTARRQETQRPDDIQIHIGRVEVVAVAAPAPAPAPERHRKSLRLAEYLEGGG